MNKSSKGTILMGTNQIIKHIEPLIAKKLKDHLKFKLIFIAKTKQDTNYYKKNFKECFHDVYNNKFKINNAYLKYHKKYKDPEKEALKIEKKYNISIFRLFFTDRVLGRGFFASGGVRHPRNRTHLIHSQKDFLNMAINYVHFWENLFKTENVKYAINLENIAHHLAIKNKIKAFKIFEGKFKSTLAWVNHKRSDPSISLSEFNKVSGAKKIEINKPYQAYMYGRKRDLYHLSLIQTVLDIFYKILQLIYGKLRGYEKSKNTYLSDEIFHLWRKRKAFINYQRLAKCNLDKLKNKKFIFFPLLTEPEVALHGIADDFFFQLSAINIISRDLPADYILVVKEHILAVGRRPKDFYTQISDLKNVLLADPNEFGLEYVKNCKAVACITGTSAWEAVVMGIPVISFSKNNMWNFLNHVYYINKFENLRNVFLSIEKNKYPNKKSVTDGANFYKIYFNKLIKLKDYNSLIPLSSNINRIPQNLKETANIIYKSLINKIKS